MKKRVVIMEKNFRSQFDVPQEGPKSGFLSTLFGKGSEFQPIMAEAEELSLKEERKVSLFERGLEQNLTATDTIDEAMKKVVKTALAAEFGPSLVKSKGASAMIETIMRGIMGDPLLRKQALVIIDRFTGSSPKKRVQVSTKKKQ
jgi:hypothetical protein